MNEKELKEVRDSYLNLIKKILTDEIYGDKRSGFELRPRGGRSPQNIFRTTLLNLIKKRGFALVRKSTDKGRREGSEWPEAAHTMIGVKRLDHLQSCIEKVVQNKVPGDLIETGVWRGGATIFMRAVLKAYGIKDRIVWVADSFRGLPAPDVSKYPPDKGSRYHESNYLAISVQEVQSNFKKYELLDGQVRFLEGWFKETLPNAPIEKLAILRIDADMYESTMDALNYLYGKLSRGGYVIIDDYYFEPRCKAAVDDFKKTNRIVEPMHKIPDSFDGIYWQKG